MAKHRDKLIDFAIFSSGRELGSTTINTLKYWGC